MTHHVKPLTAAATSGRRAASAEPESLDQLLGDCARMAPHWKTAECLTSSPGPATELRGIKVPAASAKLLEGMSEYGD